MAKTQFQFFSSSRIPNFGNTSSVEHLDPSMQYFTGYFANIADHLVKAGYTRGVNLHGAPYDFRSTYLKGVFAINVENLGNFSS